MLFIEEKVISSLNENYKKKFETALFRATPKSFALMLLSLFC